MYCVSFPSWEWWAHLVHHIGIRTLKPHHETYLPIHYGIIFSWRQNVHRVYRTKFLHCGSSQALTFMDISQLSMRIYKVPVSRLHHIEAFRYRPGSPSRLPSGFSWGFPSMGEALVLTASWLLRPRTPLSGPRKSFWRILPHPIRTLYSKYRDKQRPKNKTTRRRAIWMRYREKRSRCSVERSYWMGT